ncbi:hypothetical protein Val02_54640 [Virgisporangium aliadipatigenens]|uniref:DUF5655 domain-containing protein n=1 Tax=Virgisporangium aliadipatigenens TaxID=741659 RepID=A0A8J3YRU3_9ACTN|nr:DUF5655 domain-containing protein [Virgisporangium aliadipatigenens]GIJ48578.1 hypothetical protein Val02_54640 [Virgisporangium aliadipatigenens]
MTGRWTCPACEREFGRARQAHVCVPGCTVDDSFAGRPAEYRRIYDAIIGFVRTLGPVHEDAVSVGVFLKASRSFAEVRPVARSVNLWIVLGRPLSGARIGRAERASAGRHAHLVKLTSVDQVDDELRGWLEEAYLDG